MCAKQALKYSDSNIVSMSSYSSWRVDYKTYSLGRDMVAMETIYVITRVKQFILMRVITWH